MGGAVSWGCVRVGRMCLLQRDLKEDSSVNSGRTSAFVHVGQDRWQRRDRWQVGGAWGQGSDTVASETRSRGCGQARCRVRAQTGGSSGSSPFRESAPDAVGGLWCRDEAGGAECGLAGPGEERCLRPSARTSGLGPLARRAAWSGAWPRVAAAWRCRPRALRLPCRSAFPPGLVAVPTARMLILCSVSFT